MRISDWSSDVCSSDLLVGAEIDNRRLGSLWFEGETGELTGGQLRTWTGRGRGLSMRNRRNQRRRCKKAQEQRKGQPQTSGSRVAVSLFRLMHWLCIGRNASRTAQPLFEAEIGRAHV